MGEGWPLIDIRLYVHIIFSHQILFPTFHIFFLWTLMSNARILKAHSLHVQVLMSLQLSCNSLLVIGPGIQAVTIFERIGLIPVSR